VSLRDDLATGDMGSASVVTHGDDKSGTRRLSTERIIHAGFAFALVCLGVVGAMSYLSVLRLNDDVAWVEHTYLVLNRLDALLASVTDAQIGGRRYVTTGDPEFLERYDIGVNAVHGLIAQLHDATADNPGQRRRLAAVEALVTARIADLEAGIELRRTRGAEAAQRADPANGRRIYDDLHGGIDAMKSVESSLLRERKLRSQEASAITEAVILAGGLLAITVAGLALFAIRRDLAGRARAEQALRQAKADLEIRVHERTAELAGIVEYTDDAVITKSLTGIITSWNPGATKIFGYTREQAVGRSMLFIMPPERAAEELEILSRLVRGESVDHLETVRLRADGTLIDVSATVSPLRDSTGRVIGASKIARDITERKTNERRLQSQLRRLDLLQQITGAIGEHHDLGSIYQVVTHALEEQLPVDFACIALYDPAGQYLTVTCVGAKGQAFATQLSAPEHFRISVDQNGLGRCVQGALVYEPDIGGYSFEFPRRLVRAGYRAVVFAPLSVESKVFGVMIAARCDPASFTSNDCEFLHQLSEHLALAASQARLMSSLQEAYEDLRQSQQAMMQQERLRALGQMASGIAHDINNALSPPAIYVQLLLEHEKSLTSDARDYLKIIERSLEDIAGTISRLRTFSRPRDHEVTLSAVDLNQLLQQVAELTRARWSAMPQQHGFVIDLRRDLAAGVPPILGVEHDIRDALTNLVLNAVDAMPRGGTLTLSSRIGPDMAGRPAGLAPQRVFVEISDTGVGMTEAVRNRCLEPFFTTKGERGTGLGLAMVYGMAQRHGADVEIESELGLGTTMRLIFPAAAPAQNKHGAGATRAAPPLRLLVIDDDPLLLRSLRDMLESDGHTVVTADGGQKGIDLLLSARARGEPFAAVISDLGMPNMDGHAVATAVKTAAPGMPFVLLTGWGQTFGEADPPEHVDRVLSKPPKLRQLRAVLTELV
jgi:PAS domain S-box-containing protein